jgi:DnaJ-domain-containing protein 1
MARSRNEHLDVEFGPRAPVRGCDQPGCPGEGLFRAPRTRDRVGDLESYHWFCLEHVRSYNAAWNYYAGLSEAEMERELRRSMVGGRPTWPLGWRVAGRKWRDPLNLYAEHGPEGEAKQEKVRPVPDDERQALRTFDMTPPFSLAQLKARYKVLVKRHHPDANGGNKASEEKLKLITRAYAFLKSRFFG